MVAVGDWTKKQMVQALVTDKRCLQPCSEFGRFSYIVLTFDVKVCVSVLTPSF